MTKPYAAVFCGRGLNTDEEMIFALNKAGAHAESILLMDWLSGRATLDKYNIAVIPGGFVDGDDIACGRVLANELRTTMRDEIQKFLERDTLFLGICNGFQVQTKAGLIPYTIFQQTATLADNESGHFDDLWVHLEINPNSPCIVTKDIDCMYLPVRHGEGKYFAKPDEISRMERDNFVVARYVGENGEQNPAYPANPNGSVNAIAGVCDPTGRVFGMMPHPEAFCQLELHPQYTRLKAAGRLPEEPDGLKIFRNAVKYFE